ncbi:MAG: efflux RND transporter periplasmic adaptor subunit [Candidatus Rifleibacteriota bacterium]
MSPNKKTALVFLSMVLYAGIACAQVNVVTEKVKTGTIRKLLRFTGETRPLIETFAAADVAGPVAKIQVEDGQEVKKDQTLAVIDEVRFDISLRMAQAALDRANQQLIEDQRDFERNKTLFDKSAITQKTFDMAETALVKSKTNVKQMLAELDKAKLDLQRCAIKAPISGFFVDRAIDLGQAMNRGQNMGKVIDLSTIFVEAKIPEKEIYKIKIGQKCLIEEKFPGEISFINLYADNSRAFKVKMTVPNPEIHFKANMFVKGSIILEQYDSAPIFPSRAIRNYRGQQFAFVVENGIAKRINLNIIAQEGEMTHAGEIKENMEIVTVGQDNLDDGTPVSLRNGNGNGNGKK